MVSTAEKLFQSYSDDYEKKQGEEFSLTDYLDICKSDKMAYATAAERLLDIIGDPEIIHTENDERLSRIYGKITLSRYKAFDNFFGMEEIIMKIVGHIRHAAQGLEESKQILYFLGPVGSAKSSLAERLKALIEERPIYVLCDKDGNPSPINESPLGLFNRAKHGGMLQAEYQIDPRYLKSVMSPWAIKRLKEYKGDISRFTVKKLWPSIQNQLAVSKTEPGDDNNQDISALVGKVDIRKLEEFEQKDTDAYSYSGGLCTGNRGIMEFVEMFKAPIKVLHPLLTATQEGNFNGTETIGAIPFEGLILAHSNENEWQSFVADTKNEAFLDRVNIVRVPYNLQVSQEIKIYQKMIDGSELKKAPCAPGTLDMMAQFAVMARLAAPEGTNIRSKMKVYDGENIKAKDPKAKSAPEYRDEAGHAEGMGQSISTRFAYKTLSAVFNMNAAHGGEIAADPVHLMAVLKDRIYALQLDAEKTKKYIGFIDEYLQKDYREFLGKEINQAFLENSKGYGQNMFERYITYAEAWTDDSDYRDPDTGILMSRVALDKELEKFEKPAGIANAKDFRNEVVRFVMRHQRNHGAMPDWLSYEKMKLVIEKRVFTGLNDMLPIISFGAKANEEDKKKHLEFVERMESRGYTANQVRHLTDWYLHGPMAA